MSKPLRLEVKSKIYYPWLNKPNPKSNKYQLALGHLDDSIVRQLKDYGATVSTKDGMGTSISVKNARAVKVYDAQGNELPASILGKIGNGTTAIVRFAIVPTKKGNPGQYLDEVQIIDLVEYAGARKGFEKQEGYTIAAGGNIIEEEDGEDWDDEVND